MTESEERAYAAGGDAVWRQLLGQCLSQLGADSPEATAQRWLLERAEAVAVLRRLCAEFGDLDWDRSLHLADVIEKHLGRHLREKR